MGLTDGADWPSDARAEQTKMEATAEERQKSVIAEFLMGLCKSGQSAGWSQRIEISFAAKYIKSKIAGCASAGGGGSREIYNCA
jgi:hypothetical protein